MIGKYCSMLFILFCRLLVVSVMVCDFIGGVVSWCELFVVYGLCGFLPVLVFYSSIPDRISYISSPSAHLIFWFGGFGCSVCSGWCFFCGLWVVLLFR